MSRISTALFAPAFLARADGIQILLVYEQQVRQQPCNKRHSMPRTFGIAYLAARLGKPQPDEPDWHRSSRPGGQGAQQPVHEAPPGNRGFRSSCGDGAIALGE